MKNWNIMELSFKASIHLEINYFNNEIWKKVTGVVKI